MKITILLTLIACLSMQQLSSASEGSLGNVRALKAKATKSPKGKKSPKSTKHVINFDEIELPQYDLYSGNDETGLTFDNTYAFNATFMDIFDSAIAWDEVTVSKPNCAAAWLLGNPVIIECPGGSFNLKAMTIGNLRAICTADFSAKVDAFRPNNDHVDSAIIDFDYVGEVKRVEFPDSFKYLGSVTLHKKVGGWDLFSGYGFDDIEVEINYPC